MSRATATTRAAVSAGRRTAVRADRQLVGTADPVGTRKFQWLRRIGHHGAPVGEVRLMVTRDRGRRRVGRRAEVGTGVRTGEIGEENLPRTVIPGDVVCHQQHDVLVGRGAHQSDPQRCVDLQVEWCGELALCQHLQPQPARMVGEPGQVVLGPTRPQIGMNFCPRFAVLVDGVGGAQHGMPVRDSVERHTQPCGVDSTGDAVGQADVEQCAGRVGLLNEPHPQRRVGESAGPAVTGGMLGLRVQGC